MKQLSKKARSQIIYNKMIPTNTKPEIVKAFITELEMTPAGANTYFNTCRKGSSIRTITSSKQSTFKRTSSTTDTVVSKVLYTVCTPSVIVKDPITRTESEMVLESTGSFYDYIDAVAHCALNEVIVKGLPEIGLPFSKLKQINSLTQSTN